MIVLFLLQNFHLKHFEGFFSTCLFHKYLIIQYLYSINQSQIYIYIHNVLNTYKKEKPGESKTKIDIHLLTAHCFILS